MGDTWVPEDVFSMEPFVRNFFENTSTVQVTFSPNDKFTALFTFSWKRGLAPNDHDDLNVFIPQGLQSHSLVS